MRGFPLDQLYSTYINMSGWPQLKQLALPDMTHCGTYHSCHRKYEKQLLAVTSGVGFLQC